MYSCIQPYLQPHTVFNAFVVLNLIQSWHFFTQSLVLFYSTLETYEITDSGPQKIYILKCPFHDVVVGVWCAVSGRRIVGPVFYTDTVNLRTVQGIYWKSFTNVAAADLMRKAATDAMIVHGTVAKQPSCICTKCMRGNGEYCVHLNICFGMCFIGTLMYLCCSNFFCIFTFFCLSVPCSSGRSAHCCVDLFCYVQSSLDSYNIRGVLFSCKGNVWCISTNISSQTKFI
jgi:hypothetical protein